MVKPTLLVLAAGMGSRYGSLKQMEGIGPGNEAIMDYSVYDAVRAGFGKVVFVIRRDFEHDFREVFSAERFGGKIEVDYVFQGLESLPEGFSVPEGRVKPWGTNHAVMMGETAVREPFAVINADDFYGRDAFARMADYLRTVAGTEARYCMVGYRLGNTLSENGSVSRGVCRVDPDGNLISMVERTSIERTDGGIFYTENGERHPLDEETTVSMNLFGFTPDYFLRSGEYFKRFLIENAGNEKAEFFIPMMVNKLISDGAVSMKVLKTDSQWFGVTYREDKPSVVRQLNALIENGDYPKFLWK